MQHWFKGQPSFHHSTHILTFLRFCSRTLPVCHDLHFVRFQACDPEIREKSPDLTITILRWLFNFMFGVRLPLNSQHCSQCLDPLSSHLMTKIRYTSHILQHTYYKTHITTHISHHTSNITNQTSHISYHTTHMIPFQRSWEYNIVITHVNIYSYNW